MKACKFLYLNGYVRAQAVKPRYQRRADYFLWQELGKRLGQEADWPETLEVTPRSTGGGDAGGGTLLCGWVREGRGDAGVGMIRVIPTLR